MREKTKKCLDEKFAGQKDSQSSAVQRRGVDVDAFSPHLIGGAYKFEVFICFYVKNERAPSSPSASAADLRTE